MVDSNQVADRLQRTVSVASLWLGELDEEAVRHKPSADRWSIAEVLGHLIDSACNNHQRFIRAQDVSELVFPKYEQNEWVARNQYQSSEWAVLLDLWSSYNLHLAHVIRQIPGDQMEKSCTIAPYNPCALGFLVEDYVDHLEHHLAKIRERLTSEGNRDAS